MRLRAVFRFELAYQLRRVTPWLCFAVLFLFALWMMVGPELADDLRVNAPYVVAFNTVLAGVIWLLTGASVAGDAAARDVQTRMHPLTYTAPVSRAEYLGGRFLAALALNCLILLAVPLGLLIGLILPGDKAGLVGPFRPAAYLTAYGFVALPVAFVATALQFAWATLARRAMAAYLASVLLFATSHFVVMMVAGLLERWELVRLLDVVGIGGIVNGLENTWTTAEKNTRLVLLEGPLLWNRLLWLGVAAGALALTYSRFRLAHPAEGGGRSRAARRRTGRSPAHAAAAIPESAPVVVPQVRRSFGLGTYARQTLGIAWTSFRAVAKSRAGLALVAVFALQLVVFMPEYVKFMGVPMLPVTGRILGSLTAAVGDVGTPLVVIPLLIAFYAGELFWRERDAGMGDITDAAPVPEWTLFVGKLLGLGLALAAWLAILAAAGILAQAVMGHHDFQVGLYLKVLFGLQLPEYLLFACLALALHVAVNRKYLGHVAALLALGAIGFAPRLGLRHDLLVYGAGPGWSYTEMRGFGGSVWPWLWFRAYWAAWALLLVVAARLLWARDREGSPGARLRTARRRLTRATVGAVAVAVGLGLGLGGFVFYNTNVLHEYRTASDDAREAAEYERRYRRYADAPQPLLGATRLHVEIHPERRQVEIRGTYRLVNRGEVPIDTIHLATVPEVRTTGVAFGRPAARVLSDDDLGHHVYALREPLRPGDSLTMGFAVLREARGFREGGVDEAVVANGTLFGNRDWLPMIGYQPLRELRGEGERRAHGLAGAPSLPGSLHGSDYARRYVGGAELIDFEATVGTDADQVAIAPGTLRRTWTEGGRRYFHYATDAPIRNEYALFSARYALHEARWEDPAGSGRTVAIQVFHHPGHTANLNRMVRSIRTALTHFSAEFGPYPYRHIRFVEQAGGDGGMSADASSIAYEEGFSHFDPGDPAEGLDLPFYIVAHEVAHQWWGSQVASAYVEGAWLMSESLAVYSGMQALREEYGQDQVRRYLGLVRSIYAFPRSRAAVPLLRANESFLGYRKGAVALYALSRYVGEDRVNLALRRLVEKHSTGVPPLPTSLDLYGELRAVTPDSLRYLLHDLFEANTYWELTTDQAAAERTAAGTWRVTLDVRTRKVVVDTAGVETEVPMNDWVEVGVSALPVTGDGPQERIYLQKHRIRSGEQTITVTVPREPAAAGIDPDYLLIDLKTEDNVRRVRTGS
jgi:ABC-2 type transport system permease protein